MGKSVAHGAAHFLRGGNRGIGNGSNDELVWTRQGNFSDSAFSAILASFSSSILFARPLGEIRRNDLVNSFRGKLEASG